MSNISPYPRTVQDMDIVTMDGHSDVASLFKCDFFLQFVAVDKISTDLERRAVPLW